MFHLYCKADFCFPALRDLVGRRQDAVWVQRGICAPGLHMSHRQGCCWKQRSVQCACSWHIPAVFFSFTGEAIHLGSLIAAQGYVFPISDHVLTLKDDGTFYRFQVGEPSAFLVAPSTVPAVTLLKSLALYPWAPVRSMKPGIEAIFVEALGGYIVTS